jgi:hypothetical protein
MFPRAARARFLGGRRTTRTDHQTATKTPAGAERITTAAIMLRPIGPAQQTAGFRGPENRSRRDRSPAARVSHRIFSARNPDFALQFHFQTL